MPAFPFYRITRSHDEEKEPPGIRACPEGAESQNHGRRNIRKLPLPGCRKMRRMRLGVGTGRGQPVARPRLSQVRGNHAEIPRGVRGGAKIQKG